MTPETLFALLGPPTLLGWAILILGPRRYALLNALPAYVLPGAMSALYGALALTYFAGTGGGYGSLDAVRQLLSSDGALLAGWVHYLAFDMMIGALMARRMDAAGLARWLQAPVLLLTFLFGPVGALIAMLLTLRLPVDPMEPAHDHN